jgi:hypothetical protein
MLDGTGGAENVLVAAAAYDVLALVLATALTTYKPRRRRSAARTHSAIVGTSASRR